MILPDNAETRSHASRLIAEGKVIAFRTDTFYGLGVDALNREAVGTTRSLKGREALKPILLLISDYGAVERFISNRSEIFDALASLHWPGPITLVGTAQPDLPDELTAGTGTIGLRLPNVTDLRALVRACGGALTATSANPAGASPARRAKEVESYFPTKIDLIIDGGEVKVTQPSTVLDLSCPHPRLVREGLVSRSELEKSLARFGLSLKTD